MELLIGSHVREHGNRVGRLAGFEIDPATRRVNQIIFSTSGTLGSDALMRPLAAVSHVHDGGDIELRTDVANADARRDGSAVLLGGTTRVKRAGHDLGHLKGVDVNPADQQVLTVFGKPHWWSGRVTVEAAGVDWSTPGEIRTRA
jgi:hypothetical protein